LYVPFGKKEDAKRNIIDFEKIEALLIAPALDHLGIMGRTTGEIYWSGQHKDRYV
jgi:hypothetical protein